MSVHSCALSCPASPLHPTQTLSATPGEPRTYNRLPGDPVHVPRHVGEGRGVTSVSLSLFSEKQRKGRVCFSYLRPLYSCRLETLKIVWKFLLYTKPEAESRVVVQVPRPLEAYPG